MRAHEPLARPRRGGAQKWLCVRLFGEKRAAMGMLPRHGLADAFGWNFYRK